MIHVFPSLYSDCLAVHMDNRIALFQVVSTFNGFLLLERLRNDVLDVRMYIRPKLM